ncbi:MAG: dihydroneopterin aldolase [Bacteroidales bacterium]|nr:dihydroneopterin aldolase [Bacteroidales bacterium]
MMDRVELIDMHFYAYHGCFEEEQIIGNKFLVNFWAEADLSKPAATDNIEDALNYQLVYNVIKEQMEIKSHLLEHVARRILDAVKAQFPYIERAQVQISKLNPPLGGQVYASRVTMNL